MLTYTFSTREKVLLAFLAFVLIIVGWYQLVFSKIQSEIAQIDTQIGAAQDELVILQTQTYNMQSMQNAIDAYEEQGLEPVIVPNYDNTQSLMAYLNGILSSTLDYTITSSDPSLDESTQTMNRPMHLTFYTNTYQEARSDIEAIAHGIFPCTVTTMGIEDRTISRGKRSSSSTSTPFRVEADVVFYEKAPEGMVAKKDGSAVQGQDLSKLTQLND